MIEMMICISPEKKFRMFAAELVALYKDLICVRARTKFSGCSKHVLKNKLVKPETSKTGIRITIPV